MVSSGTLNDGEDQNKVKRCEDKATLYNAVGLLTTWVASSEVSWPLNSHRTKEFIVSTAEPFVPTILSTNPFQSAANFLLREETWRHRPDGNWAGHSGSSS